MKPIYVPILKAKHGEFRAMTHLSERAKQQIIPLFDVPQQDETKGKSVKSHLGGIASNIASVMDGKSVDLFQDKEIRKPIFIDLSQWAPNSQTEDGEHVILYLCNQLEHYGVIVNPIIRYDFFHDPAYVDAISSIFWQKKHRNYCIRLSMEHDTIQDVKADPDYVADQLLNIVEKLLSNPYDICLLIDFRDISSPERSIEKIFDEAKHVIFLAQKIGFSQFILAGASMPISIKDVVEEQDSSALLPRKEMIVWQTLLSENPSLNITFSDYGVRNSNSPDGSKSFSHTNGKIRYTIDKKYFVVRGHQLKSKSGPAKDGFQQFYNLAQKIISSGHYTGEQFGGKSSWGDREIMFHSSPDNNSGNHEKWISIETNHHIETIVMELLEFHQELRELIAKAVGRKIE